MGGQGGVDPGKEGGELQDTNTGEEEGEKEADAPASNVFASWGDFNLIDCIAFWIALTSIGFGSGVFDTDSVVTSSKGGKIFPKLDVIGSVHSSASVVLEDGCGEDELLFGLEEGLELGLVLEVQEVVGCLGGGLVH